MDVDFISEPLNARNPMQIDQIVVFNEPLHRYTHAPSGRHAPISVTKLIGKYFDDFDAHAIISKNLAKWTNEDQDGKWSELCRYLQNTMDLPREEIISEITRHWKRNGERAAKLGTQMHNAIEKYLDYYDADNEPAEAYHTDAEIRKILGMLQRWLKEFKPLLGLRPYRV